MTIFITYPIADHETIAPKYSAVVTDGEQLSPKEISETHYATGSDRLTPAQQAPLEADPDFANVTFSDTPPEGF